MKVIMFASVLAGLLFLICVCKTWYLRKHETFGGRHHIPLTNDCPKKKSLDNIWNLFSPDPYAWISSLRQTFQWGRICDATRAWSNKEPSWLGSKSATRWCTSDESDSFTGLELVLDTCTLLHLWVDMLSFCGNKLTQYQYRRPQTDSIQFI